MRNHAADFRTGSKHPVVLILVPGNIVAPVIGYLPLSITDRPHFPELQGTDFPVFWQGLADAPFEMEVVAKSQVGIVLFAMDLVTP